MFAARTLWDLTPNRLARLHHERLRLGHPVLDMTGANPTRIGLAYPAEEILEALASPSCMVYEPDPRGILSARQALAAEYARRGVVLGPDRLVLTAGTSEAYSFLLRLLADPGDEVLVPAPSYPLLELLGRINDVVLTPYPLLPDLDFAIDLEALRAAVSPRTRALLLVSPGNPTGRFLKRSELEALREICVPAGIPIVCDEVFGDFAHGPDPDRVATMAGEPALTTFVLNGLSKMLGLPQVKLAWIAASGPPAMVEEALARLEVIADTYLSVGTPVQLALPRLLAVRAPIQSALSERLRENRSWLMKRAASGTACRPLLPEGGWSAILRLPRTIGEEAWALQLLEQDGVLVHPGYFFDFPSDGWLVVSLLSPPTEFRIGIEKILRRLEDE